MAFGNIAVDTEAFGPQGQGGLLSGMLIGAQMRQMQDQQAQRQREQQQEEATAGALQGIDPNNPDSFKPLYGVNPLLAMSLEMKAAERRKAMAEEGEAQKKQNQEKYMQWSKSVASAWAQLPPDQRSPGWANAMLDASVKQYRMMDPQFADMMAQFPQQNPQWFAHALQNGGFVDPYEQDRREVSRTTQIEHARNQLPPSPAEQQRLQMERERTDAQYSASVQNTNMESLKGAETEKERFFGRKDVQAYLTVLPKVDAFYRSMETNNAADQVNQLYAMGKTLDDMGVIREEDKKSVEGTGTWMENLEALQRKVMGQGGFPPGQLEKLKRVMDQRLAGLKASYDAARPSYEASMRRRGLDPNELLGQPMQIAPDPRQQPQQSAPQTGGMAAPAPQGAPSRVPTPDLVYQQAREILRARPDKEAKVRQWLQQQGLDPSGL